MVMMDKIQHHFYNMILDDASNSP